MNAGAISLGIELCDAHIDAEGELDCRGALGMAKDAPMGATRVGLNVIPTPMPRMSRSPRGSN